MCGVLQNRHWPNYVLQKEAATLPGHVSVREIEQMIEDNGFGELRYRWSFMFISKMIYTPNIQDDLDGPWWVQTQDLDQ